MHIRSSSSCTAVVNSGMVGTVSRAVKSLHICMSDEPLESDAWQTTEYKGDAFRGMRPKRAVAQKSASAHAQFGSSKKMRWHILVMGGAGPRHAEVEL